MLYGNYPNFWVKFPIKSKPLHPTIKKKCYVLWSEKSNFYSDNLLLFRLKKWPISLLLSENWKIGLDYESCMQGRRDDWRPLGNLSGPALQTPVTSFIVACLPRLHVSPTIFDIFPFPPSKRDRSRYPTFNFITGRCDFRF